MYYLLTDIQVKKKQQHFLYYQTEIISCQPTNNLDRVKRIWYLSPMRAAKVQASLRIRAVSPEPSLLAHTSTESRGTFRQKAKSLTPLNGWACAVEICHDGMLENTNSLDGAHLISKITNCTIVITDTRIKYWKCLRVTLNLPSSRSSGRRVPLCID